MANQGIARKDTAVLTILLHQAINLLGSSEALRFDRLHGATSDVTFQHHDQGLLLCSIAGFAEIRSQKLRRAAALGIVAVDDDDEVPVLTLFLFLQRLLGRGGCPPHCRGTFQVATANAMHGTHGLA